MLKGPVGIGKTEMLYDIERYVGKKNSHVGIGSRISKAGLGDLLYTNKNLEYLLIDEMETMPRKDQALLLSVQQHGRISETLYGKVREKDVRITVFATCNDTRKIMPALLSRFFIVNMSSYTKGEYIIVAKIRLQKELKEDIIEYIAANLYDFVPNCDPRDVQQVGRLSKGNKEKIDLIIGRMSGKER
jgi:MoxR-like ATPase